VTNNAELYDFLKLSEPTYAVEEPDLVFLNMHKCLQPQPARNSVKLDESIVKYFKTKRPERPKSIGRLKPALPNPRHKSSAPKTQFPRPKSRVTTSKVKARRQMELTKEQVIELKKIYDRLDTDGNGRIDATEFARGLTRSLSKEDSMFSYFDINLSGYITFEEFLIRAFPHLTQELLTTMLQWVRERDSAMRMVVNTRNVRHIRNTKRRISKNTARDYKLMFDMYDKDRDEMLSLQELTEALSNVMSNDKIVSLMKRYGENGKVTFKSFLTLMLPAEFDVTRDFV
jgi:Ca2+-binding EF-hand superfamily protein